MLKILLAIFLFSFNAQANCLKALANKKPTSDHVSNLDIDRFRDRLRNNNLKSDDIYIEYKTPDMTTFGKILFIEHDRIFVSTVRGGVIRISKEKLNYVAPSLASKFYFKHKRFIINEVNIPNKYSLKKTFDRIIRVVDSAKATETGNIKPLARVTNKASDNTDQLSDGLEFRLAFDRRNITDDLRFVSIPLEDKILQGKIIEQKANGAIMVDIILDQDLNFERRIIGDFDTLSQIKKSDESKQLFEDEREFYKFNSQQIQDQNYFDFEDHTYKDKPHQHGIIELDLTSHLLQKWARYAIKIIEQKTSIKPAGLETELTFDEKKSIYNVWLNDIVSLVGPPQFPPIISREFMLKENKKYWKMPRIDLGRILNNKSAVCLELSMFASALFAEFGIFSRIDGGVIDPHENVQSGHAWLQVLDNNNNPLEIIDSNYTRSVHWDKEQYYEHMGVAETLFEQQMIIPPPL